MIRQEIAPIPKWPNLPLAYARLAADAVDNWVRTVPLVDLAVGILAVRLAYEWVAWGGDVGFWWERHFGGTW